MKQFIKKQFSKIVTKIKNWYWFTFEIKGDEFHKSLDFDIDRYAKCKTKEERLQYQLELVKKRNLAHELDMKHI